MMESRSETPDRREQILIEALLLFAEKGIDGTGLRDIARKVGITQPTLYHYFASKDELILALIDWQCDRVAAVQEAALGSLAGGAGLRQGLIGTAESLQAAWEQPENAAFLRVAMSELTRGTPLSARIFQRIMKPRFDRGAQLFSDLIDAGRIRDLDPQMLAVQLIGPIFFTALLRNSGHGPFPADRMREFVFQHLETFIRGIERA